MSKETTFDKAYRRISELSLRFKANESRYLSSGYQEAEVRKDFIDKFFIVLGWDVNHDYQTNPYEQEVKVEPTISAAGQRRADYAFYLSPNFHDVRFFVEAKKPHGDIATSRNYFQTIRYGWNSETPIAALTDFEQFHILDCRYKPDLQSALDRALEKYHFSDYSNRDKFEKIYWLFSREAIAAGNLEKFVLSLPRPRGKSKPRSLFAMGGYQSFDDSFLQQLDDYRKDLARIFKNNNPDLDGETITEIVQRTLDRIVFLRFLEDKGIEPSKRLEELGSRGSAWNDFMAASRQLDKIYNGVVYKKHRLLDTGSLLVDDKAFGDLCESLAPGNSPYDFNIIPIHILGSIYERFLGKVIVATDKRVRIEEKPEVRKAGGVYYTPEFIVRYIVENTIGSQIAGKTPDEISEMRFVDIACGSGSFLLQVFDLLIEYHGRYYNNHPDKARKGDCLERDGRLFLSLAKKRHILLNNIHGVDIDSQAVEVCQMSLYLKLLQEETETTALQYLLDFAHVEKMKRLLPNLSKNIVCGNSLIRTDILDCELFCEEDERLFNPMNFEDAFPDIIKKGGFDAIVGNPPYVRPHHIEKREKQYYWKHFRTFTRKSDLYCCFIERATQLMKPGALFSYIVSHGWMWLDSFQELRKLLLDNFSISRIVELPENVFADAQVKTAIIIAMKTPPDRRHEHKIEVLERKTSGTGAVFEMKRRIPQKLFHSTYRNVFDISLSPETEAIKAKMRQGPSIDSLFRVCFGLKTGDDNMFLHRSKGLHREDRPLLRGEDVKRYCHHYRGEFVWYVPDKMRAHRSTARPGEAERFEQPKILVKDTSADFAGTFDNNNFYVKDVLIIIPQEGASECHDLRYLLGIINSQALTFYYRTTFNTIHVQRGEIGSLPLPSINMNGHDFVVRQEEIIRKVEAMMAAQMLLAESWTDKDKDFYENKCAGVDAQINRIVYDLYGLTEGEVDIIEKTMKRPS